MRHDRRIALTDAGGFHDHQIEARHFAGRNHIRQRLRNFGTGFARCQRAHEHARLTAPRINRIHADAVTEQAPPDLRREGSIEISAIFS
jgi:hypothetical protein